MKFVPHGSKTHGKGWGSSCGQACLAMLADVSIEEATAAIGHRNATTWSHLIKGLNMLEIDHGRQTRHHPKHAALPLSDRRTYLVRVRAKDGKKEYDHWIVLHRGMVFDPSTEILPRNEFLKNYGWRFTSFMEIELPPHDPDEYLS